MRRRMVWVTGLAAVMAGAVATGLLATGGQAGQQRQTTTTGQANRSKIVLSTDIDWAPNEAALVSEASLVVRGTVGSDVRLTPRSPDGLFVDFYLPVQVEEVVGGQDPGSAVTVVWAGLSPSSSASVEDPDAGLSATPPSPGEYVLFLQPSAEPGVYQIVGHTQGLLSLDASGRVAAVGQGGFRDMVGLTVAEIAQRIHP